MEAPPDVTEVPGACADAVDKLSCVKSVAKTTSTKIVSNQKTVSDELYCYNSENDNESDSECSGVSEKITAGKRDNAYSSQSEEQVNKTLQYGGGDNKVWHKSFNLWRENSCDDATKNEHSLKSIDDENANAVIESQIRCSPFVLDVVCGVSDIESAFSKCCVFNKAHLSESSKQSLSSEAEIDDDDDSDRKEDNESDIVLSKFEDKHLSSSSNNFNTLLFGPITNLFKLSRKRLLYPYSLIDSKVGWEDMGNLQGSESKKGGEGKGKSPGKAKKEKGKKSPAKELKQHKAQAPPPPTTKSSVSQARVQVQQQQKAVPPQGNVHAASSHAPVASNNGNQEPQQRGTEQSNETTTYVVTDSWRHVKKLAIKTPAPNNNSLLTPPSRDSSSESVFTDPLTPQGFADAQNNGSVTSSYYSDPCSNERHNHQLGAGFQTITNGAEDSVFSSLTSDTGMVVSDGAMGVSDRDKRGDSTSPSGTDLDDVTLTLVDSQEQLTDGEELSNGTSMTAATQKRPQSHSLDALDEEDNVDEAEKKAKSRSADALEMTSGATSPGAGSSRTSQPPSSFTLVRHRKVELNPTRLSEHCLTGSAQQTQDARDTRRHSSVSDAPLESNVLRKVASLTLDKATIDQKVARPKFVPEKLDFQIYEKFEGQMLINWFVSAFPDEHYLRIVLTSQDLRILAAQFCTHLLAAGVLRQIPDKDVILEPLFRPDLMYYWSHAEVPAAAPPTPGRLTPAAWPPSSPFAFSAAAELANAASNRPGARYTEAETAGRTSAPVSPTPITEARSPVKTPNKPEGEEPEFQQVVMGLKREHRDNLDRLTKDQEVALFTVRGEHAHRLSEADERIVQLETTIARLSQELERYKTLSDIQSLTDRAKADFDSPTEAKLPPSLDLVSSESEKKDVQSKEVTKMSPEVTSKDAETTVESATVSTSTEHLSAFDKSTDTSDLPKPPVDVPVSKTAEPSTAPSVSIDPKSEPSSEKLQPAVSETVEMKSDITKDSASISLIPESSSVPTTSQQRTESEETVPTPPSEIKGPPPPPPPPIPETQASVAPPPPPPMSGMGPPPPPMPGMGPPPPPMAGMGPPPPPMPGMGPPPPPMPGMGPPPPPMPGMGPPPPPLPGMGPPPPPLPGMGPAPPPLPGVGGAPPPPPPPGIGSPLPFPTPPAGGWMANRAMAPGLSTVLRKPPLNPVCPMKPLYWTRIIVPPTETEPDIPSQPTSSPGGLWHKLEEAEIEDIKEFSDLFSRQVVERKPTKKKEEKPSKIQVVKILDGKRSQSVGILASSLHVDFSEIENAIYNFDTSMVNLEALHQIYEVRATDEELTLIREQVSSKSDVSLDKPEQFLLELAEIPNFADRIACFMFQSEFEDRISTIESKLNNLKSTCQFMMTSESLKTVLAIILTLGNYMNGGNRTRGQADGFGLEILAKLKDVKSKEGSMTLLHFIVRAYMKKLEDPLAPGVALPVPEPGDIDRAATVLFDDIDGDLKGLQKELTVCEQRTQKVLGASTEENIQPFKDKMEKFLGTAKTQLSGEMENLEECKQKFKATMQFYHFQPKGGANADEADPKDFFALWTPFCSDFKDIWKKEQQRLIKEKTQEVKRVQEKRKSDIQKSTRTEGGLKSKMLKRRQLE